MIELIADFYIRIAGFSILKIASTLTFVTVQTLTLFRLYVFLDKEISQKGKCSNVHFGKQLQLRIKCIVQRKIILPET